MRNLIQVEASQRERRKFLELALTNYGKTLARSEEGRHDVIVFRDNSYMISALAGRIDDSKVA